MSFVEEVKKLIKEAGGNFNPVLKCITSQNLEVVKGLSNDDFVFLKRVLEKLQNKKVDAQLLKNAVYKVELAEKQSGKKKLRIEDSFAREEDFQSILKRAKEENAQVVHLKAGEKPYFRVANVLKELSGEVELSSEDLFARMGSTFPTEQVSLFMSEGTASFSLSLPGISRFKVSCAMESGQPSLSFKQIPLEIPTPDAVQIENSVQHFFDENKKGLALICGGARSGKSTTCAALLQRVNEQHSRRILTIEDPIEFLFQDRHSSVTQREMGSDILSREQAYRYALSDGADILFISEIKDLEDLDFVLRACESDHLVLSTVGANTCREALLKIAEMLPKDVRHVYLDRLSRALGLMQAQTLATTATGSEIAVTEVLFVEPSVKTMIRENNLMTVQNYLDQLQGGDSVSFHRRFKDYLDKGMLDLNEVQEQIPDSESFLKRFGGV